MGAREKFYQRLVDTVWWCCWQRQGQADHPGAQFLYIARMVRDKMVAVTQPRRVCSSQPLPRVAKEMGGEVGGVVGFRVRFQDVSDSNTKLLYQTDGMLLRRSHAGQFSYPGTAGWCWTRLMRGQ